MNEPETREYKPVFPEVKQKLTPEQISEGKAKGNIVMIPEKSANGKMCRTTDKRQYNIHGPSGGLQSLNKPLSKKAAKKLAQKARRQ